MDCVRLFAAHLFEPDGGRVVGWEDLLFCLGTTSTGWRDCLFLEGRLTLGCKKKAHAKPLFKKYLSLCFYKHQCLAEQGKKNAILRVKKASLSRSEIAGSVFLNLSGETHT